ncbi:hypothetical protein [Leptospirillum ferriphilum]|uniref:Lipoprotein n=3 Tax=Leptospirillum ferriphilum TaxID=178606 RepID=A0A059Y214_9BACT|nr:hypothetical protein [Leptospirillum ferriphilum]AFS53237.1 hypothetical protein LFML04_1006 [Leptospirillum ferriphilum ML-04]AIA31606.1 hypothetical protein Y981_04460 [Leptospirillum ferriphilum YSK]OOH75165.1 hypothetical protein BOX24_01165 [Leptospirillum ferriphilum]OOH78791.1 hypothetical protein BOX30_07505 [Leptospirillum ferriphilum]
MRKTVTGACGAILCVLGACATAPDANVAPQHLLLDDHSTRFYVKTIPVPPRSSQIIVIRKAVLDTIHHISFSEFLRQSEPHSVKAHYYLMDYSRTVVESPEDHPEGEWKYPVFGSPYRFRYKGTVVVLRSEWEAEKEREKKKLAEALRKEQRKKKVEDRLGSGLVPLVKGPEGGKILQEDKDALTEVLPSGAYIVHPASELTRRGYRFVDGQWEGPSPNPS